MIETAEEFVRLRNSEIQAEYHRAAHEEAPLEVWQDVLLRFPDMAFWVAQNKSVPYEILEQLSDHEEDRVRTMVAMKNRLQEPLLVKLAQDSDASVRMEIARHNKVTAPVLELLATDSWTDIAELASGRLAEGAHR